MNNSIAIESNNYGLTVEQIANIIRFSSQENAELDMPTSNNFEMDCKIEHVDYYFNTVHEDDYLVFKYFADSTEIFLDIGANAGYSATSVWATGSKLGVISFEPIPFYQEHLEKIKKKAPFFYDYHICGLSNIAGVRTFYTPTCNGLGLSAYTQGDLDFLKKIADMLAQKIYNYITEVYKKPVENFLLYKFTSSVSTLDAFLTSGALGAPGKTIAVIKIDTEGHEPSVLLGAFATLARYKPLLMVERNSNDKSLGILVEKILMKQGYVKAYRHGANLSLQPQNSVNVYNDFYISESMIAHYTDIGLWIQA